MPRMPLGAVIHDRERLERHLAMKAAGEESGETEAFYDAAARQGVPENSSGGGATAS